MPVDPRLPKEALSRLFEALQPQRILDSDMTEHAIPGGRDVCAGDAIVIATSGTSGEPKGVVHTHDSIRASATATNSALGVDPISDRWLCCLPLAHVGGLSVVTRAITSGTPVDIHGSFDADAVETAAREGGATLTSLVPTALQRIDSTLFRKIVVGGSAPHVAIPPNAVVSYGMTETGSAVVYDGKALDGVEIRVLDGEIHVRGQMLMRCYRDDSDPRDPEGWFATGDEGELDDRGNLIVHGRRGEMITTGGEKVWPAPVEAILSTHHAIHDVAITGEPDANWGEIVVAVVVPEDGKEPPELGELRELVKRTLPAFMAPKRMKIVSSIARTPIGKLRRQSLRTNRTGSEEQQQ